MINEINKDTLSFNSSLCSWLDKWVDDSSCNVSKCPVPTLTSKGNTNLVYDGECIDWQEIRAG